MADENEALFKEIEEEVRQDKAYRLWKTYRYYIIFTVIGLVASVACFQAWQSYQIAEKIDRGEAYSSVQSLIETNSVEPALSKLRDFSIKKNDGYSRLAKFREAALLTDTDAEAALDIYRRLSDDSEISQRYRDLAVILGALRQIGKDVKSNDLIKRVAQLNSLDNPWRHSAREILALNQLQSGNREKAISLLEEVINDATTPSTLASRVKEFLKSIK